jgi:hypothetical protein
MGKKYLGMNEVAQAVNRVMIGTIAVCVVMNVAVILSMK